MPFEPGPQFLKEKYNLHNQPEVEDAVSRAKSLDGESIVATPTEQIQTYLDRLDDVLNPSYLEGHEGFNRQARNLSLLKSALHKRFVIKPDEIPNSYWNNQARMARELGHGDIEVTDEAKTQGAEIIIADQKSSLNKWIDYLSKEDAMYPLWLKYYAVRSILCMSTYDKEKHQFGKRDSGTCAPFPDLDYEALAYVLDKIEKRQGDEYRGLSEQIKQAKNKLKQLGGSQRKAERESLDTSDLSLQIEETRQLIFTLSKEQLRLVSGSLEMDEFAQDELKELVKEADFAKLYAWAIEKITPASEEELQATEGVWIKYENSSDHIPLVRSLEGYGTGWCTAGESTAATQLESGDFYVYYSKDKQGNNTIPRAAIRMQEGSIAEVRGIATE